jgi:molecular chaperone DnaK
MGRTTIDFGIDLGTTNSGIAILRGAGTEIIKNNLENDITPSAVFIDRHGKIRVGQLAKNKQEDQRAVDDIYIEFKLRMDRDHKYEFKTSGRTMKPVELSAEVLKSLRGDVQQRLGEDIHAAVITVPAVFEQKECAATRKAGELAGFSQCPLLQEPVAAALAYGFQADVTKEYWFVYDFGGGTFDAAIMKAEEGSINVVHHGGDNPLGGSHIDWAIVEQLIIPELVDNYDLPDFSRGNMKWRPALAVIKRAAENAKIRLSRSDTTDLEDCRIKDAQGEEIEVEFTLTRDALINVAEPFIIRSVEICKRVLKEKKLGPKDIDKIILVGGPTLAPYFREILHSSLGIQLDHSVDPLTVVARGAAVFAGTQRIEGKAAPKAVAGQFNVSLVYKTMGPDRDPQVRGEVKSLDSSSVEGFTVEFVNRTDGAKDLLGWRSGKIPLKADGKFRLRLAAEKGVRNTYAIEFLDPRGSTRTIVPDTAVYTMTGGAGVISEQPIINSISVALTNNERSIFFNKGGSLPAKKTEVFRSAHALHKGESGEVLKVPIVEGEMERADHNSLLGSLEIKGASIRRDLPAGTEIEVTLIYDASRILTAKAYVPMLDEEFKAVIEYDERSPEYPELKKQFEHEEHRHEEMVVKAHDTESKSLAILVEDIEESGKLEEIEKLLDAGRGDPDAAKQAEKRLLDLRINLDKAEDLLKWPYLVTQANRAIDELDKLIEAHDMPEHQKPADKLREQVEELVSQERAAPLRKMIEQIIDLHREILFAQSSYWVGWFEYLEKQRAKMSDTGAADRLCNQGYQCIQKEDISGLANVVRQLFQLLPREVAEEVERERGYQSGLLK